MAKPNKKLSSKFHTIFWACFSLFMFVLDLASKWIVEKLCQEGVRYTIIENFLYVCKSYNTGSAFSLGANNGVAGRVIFIIISAVMSAIIAIYYFVKRNEHSPFMKAMLALLFAGGIGNLIDRAFYWEGTFGFDGVIDFIQFYLTGGPGTEINKINPFATFNWADSCLTIGVILFIVYLGYDIIARPEKEKRDEQGNLIKESTEENNPTRDGGVKDALRDEEEKNRSK